MAPTIKPPTIIAMMGGIMGLDSIAGADA